MSSRGERRWSKRACSSSRTPVTPMMDLEGDIPGNICTTAMLCSFCGNTFPNKKSHDGHMELCPAMARANIQTPDSENSPRKDFSISGLLKQEDMKTEMAEEQRPVEEDIVILSESLKPGPSRMQPPAQPPRLRPQPPAQASYLAPAPPRLTRSLATRLCEVRGLALTTSANKQQQELCVLVLVFENMSRYIILKF